MNDLNEVYKLASYNKEHIMVSDKCGCFYCQETFFPSEINEWCDGGETAICPKCSVDSVICGTPEFLSPELLSDMHDRWFTEGIGC